MSRLTLPLIAVALVVLFALFFRQAPSQWADGMEAIHWDRDTCARCSMVISDPRFAIELRGGPKNIAFKFDDIGCLARWLQQKGNEYPWMNTASIWIADFDSVVENRDTLRWLDARTARYITRVSPMGANFTAVQTSTEPSISFDEVLQRTGKDQ